VPGKLKFLDFGMGWGQWCRMAGAYGCTVFGSEMSHARIAHAISVGVKIVDWEDIPKYQFDFINVNQVFEHLVNPLETIFYLCNSLKPEGIVRISVPDGSDIKRRLEINDWTAPKNSQDSLNPIAPLEHLNCYSHTSLVHMAESAGLVPLSIQEKMIRSHKNLIDLSIRDILRPFYRRLVRDRSESKKVGTSLYFKRRMSFEKN
jgi:2-polyprenyl-3-methyl-5-hydroxy-6-metoxy-1,4-benzoquinol methylase